MRMWSFKRFLALVVMSASSVLSGTVVQAQETLRAAEEALVPERRAILTRDVDFLGADLQALFDTDIDTCQRQCLADPACRAFTFNTRSNACFPKSAVTQRAAYEGAISGLVVENSSAVEEQAEDRANDLSFMRPRDFRAALAQARGIGSRYMGGQWSSDALLNAARDIEAQGNLPQAHDWTGAALAQSDTSDLWAEYARLALANLDNEKNRSEQRRMIRDALSAGVNAYLRASTDPDRVSALFVLAQALESSDRGREMIPALRLAQSLQPRDDVQAALDSAIAKHGFRITDHAIRDGDAGPRICATFSEPLRRAGLDYTPYVRLPDAALVVSSSERALCVAGVQYGERYSVTFRSGLPAASGETLSDDVTITQFVPDRAPFAAFQNRAYVLPRTASAGLPIDTVNLSEVELTLRHVTDRNLTRAIQTNYFGAQLGGYRGARFHQGVGEVVWTGTGEVALDFNKTVTTRLPMGEIIADKAPGLYALTAYVPATGSSRDAQSTTQWFVLSDLGLSSYGGAEGLHVFVRGLRDARGREAVTVELVSRSNRVLDVQQTDENGYLRFDEGLMRGEHGAEPALIVAKAGDDLSFLSLTDPAFDLSDRGVEGRQPAGPIDVFLATDRGAYRAGDTIHVTALTRDPRMTAIEGLPLTAVLTRPDGVEYSRSLSDGGRAGGHVFSFGTGPDVPRGSWRIAVYGDPDAPALADDFVLVEDLVPERIDFDLSMPETGLSVQKPMTLEIDSRYLFGAPGADLPAEIRVRLSRASSFDGFDGYVFGRHDTRFDPRVRYMDEDLRTDADGKLSVTLAMPELDADLAGLPLRMDVLASLSEGSARPVERRLRRTLEPTAPIIGLKPLFDGVAARGAPVEFDAVALDQAGAPAATDATWTLNRLTNRYEWYRVDGRWRWERTLERTEVDSGDLTFEDAPARIAANVDWGRYELVVERADGAGIPAATTFYAGWYVPADPTRSPDTIEMSLDKPDYRAGDTAVLNLVPRYDGIALVSVMTDRVVDMTTVEVTKGENRIPLEVTPEWGTGAYVTAQVIRPMDVDAGQNPARALGVAHAQIAPGDKALDVALNVPETADPRGTLTAQVKVDGIAPGESAFVTVAATDLGILNITGFSSPDPQAYYFGQRRLGIEFRDLYGRLINGLDGGMGRVRSGGDAGASVRFNAPPPIEEMVALFSGLVEVGPDGRAEVSFDMPEFNGTVRLAAVAWSPSGVGQAEADVLVRDPVVLSASLPRFMAPGDQSRLLLEIVHADGPTGRMSFDATATDGVTLDAAAIPAEIRVEQGSKSRVSIPVVAHHPGDHSITLSLTTPEDRLIRKTLTLAVRNNDPVISDTRRFSLAPGETFTFDDNVFSGLRSDTASAVVAAGPLARFDAPRLLSELDSYPYGCTEQITSRALPLLYLGSVLRALDLADDDGKRIEQRIDETIAQLMTRQAPNGAFGLWRAESGDFWLDAYASDFLSRARAAGHEVPDARFRQAMDNLANRVNYAPDFDNGGEALAYALMVLAREGAAAIGDLRYYADVKSEEFATPLAAAQLGAALAIYGDQRRADRMFSVAERKLDQAETAEAAVLRVDYGTNLRDSAGLLSLAVEAGSDAIDRAALVRRLSGTRDRLSTQEQAWSLLAAHAMVQDPTVSGIRIDGTPVSGPAVRRFAEGAAPRRITNTGAQGTDVTLTRFGKPMEPVSAGGYGYHLTRSYYGLDGSEHSGPIQVGDRLVVVLRVSPADKIGARLMINDPLPAGLEIDNPNLLGSGDIDALDWLKPKTVRHSEFRADRFLAAVDHRGEDAFDLAYIVRAISPGRFHHPAAIVEDMYRPQYRARTSSGQIAVQE